MFTCTLEAASKTPLCEQLYTALKREMERGGIRPGERMPSKRELAAHLSVSTATVEAAYARLISEGLCESRPRSGIYALEQAQRVGLLAAGQHIFYMQHAARDLQPGQPRARILTDFEHTRRTRRIFPTPRGRG